MDKTAANEVPALVARLQNLGWTVEVEETLIDGDIIIVCLRIYKKQDQ